MRLITICVLILMTAQGGGFPRDVTDTTGRTVHIPTRPQIVAEIGSVPGLSLLTAPENLRPIDLTAPGDWTEVDLLVVPDAYTISYPALIEAAEAAGVSIFRTAAISGLDEWKSLVERLGAALGREDRAAEVLRRLDQRQEAIRQAIGNQTPVRVLILTPEGYTFGQNTLITDLIAAAGGINVAAEAGYADYRQIDDETIQKLAPDVILLSPAWTESPRFAGNARVIQLPFSPTMPSDPAAALLVLDIALHPTQSVIFRLLYNGS